MTLSVLREVAMPNNKLLGRIRAEFLEMPGLGLTLEQAQRLCGVERTLCKGCGICVEECPRGAVDLVAGAAAPEEASGG